jgi:hypothetical protein
MTRKVNVWKAHTKLRQGGITYGTQYGAKDNILDDDLDTGDYPALYQMVGEKISEDGAENAFWVKIKANGREGWVSGVCVDKSGHNNKPIRDTDLHELPIEPTTFA